jgi:hypothetical protein
MKDRKNDLVAIIRRVSILSTLKRSKMSAQKGYIYTHIQSEDHGVEELK